MIEFTTDLDCKGHPAMAVIVIVGMDNVTHVHRHVDLATTARLLDDLTDQVRAEILAEVARADLP